MGKDDNKRKRKLREREVRRLRHSILQERVGNLQTKGVYIKRLYRQRGINLPFYDSYDSYFEEFGKVVAQAKQQLPSLLGIFEVEDAEYYESDRSRFAPGMQQIFWRSEAEHSGYGTARDESNINGYTNAFHAGEGQVKTLVIIRKTVPKSKPQREYRYVLKLISLLHELGHVHDIERQVNFNHAAKTCDIIEAEVFAHVYSLQRMAERNYYQCFNLLTDTLRKCTTDTSYLGEVAKLTLERMPDHKLIDINSIPLEPLTPADIEALGFDGRRALGIK